MEVVAGSPLRSAKIDGLYPFSADVESATNPRPVEPLDEIEDICHARTLEESSPKRCAEVPMNPSSSIVAPFYAALVECIEAHANGKDPEQALVLVDGDLDARIAEITRRWIKAIPVFFGSHDEWRLGIGACIHAFAELAGKFALSGVSNVVPISPDAGLDPFNLRATVERLDATTRKEISEQMVERYEIAKKSSDKLTDVRFMPSVQVALWLSLMPPHATAALVSIEDAISKHFPSGADARDILEDIRLAEEFAKIARLLPETISTALSALTERIPQGSRIGGSTSFPKATEYVFGLLSTEEPRSRERVELGTYLGGALGLAILAPLLSEPRRKSNPESDDASNVTTQLMLHLLSRMANPRGIDVGETPLGQAILELEPIRNLVWNESSSIVLLAIVSRKSFDRTFSRNQDTHLSGHATELLADAISRAAMSSPERREHPPVDLLPSGYHVTTERISQLGFPTLVARQCNSDLRATQVRPEFSLDCAASALGRGDEALADSLLTICFLYSVNQHFTDKSATCLQALATFVRQHPIRLERLGPTVDAMIELMAKPESLELPPEELRVERGIRQRLAEVRGAFENIAREIGPSAVEIASIRSELATKLIGERFMALSHAMKENLIQAIYSVRILDKYLVDFDNRSYGLEVIALMVPFEKMLGDALEMIYQRYADELRLDPGRPTLGTHIHVILNFYKYSRQVQAELKKKLPLLPLRSKDQKDALRSLKKIRNEGAHESPSKESYLELRELLFGSNGLFAQFVPARTIRH